MRISKTTTNFILFLTLSYPLGYSFNFILTTIGYNLNYLVFAGFQSLLWAYLVYIQSFRLYRKDKLIFVATLLLLGLIVYNWRGVETLVAILLVSQILLFLLLLRHIGRPDRDVIYVLLFLYLLASFLLLFDSSRFINLGRYNGFSGSSTTFSVYLTALISIYLHFSNNNLRKICFYSLGLFFIYLSQTRLNLAFYILMPIFVMVIRQKWFGTKFLYFLVVLGTISVYPTYLLAKGTILGETLVVRYENGEDASSALRLALTSSSISYFNDGSLKEKLIGQGFGESRTRIKKEFGSDWKPHNDFLRLLIDFGVVGLCLFLLILYQIFHRNELNSILISLYLLSFYHNMIYDLFLISLALFFLRNLPSLIIEKDRFEY